MNTYWKIENEKCLIVEHDKNDLYYYHWFNWIYVLRHCLRKKVFTSFSTSLHYSGVNELYDDFFNENKPVYSLF